ncbi:MAG: hypothetical protein DSM106950_40885 [Stigonema ocellatum SAG 48.90 = DSM 106950]|nr:hypothetical protein [Stigonema ocellatum SAG 48.90 = DSM 106950]
MDFLPKHNYRIYRKTEQSWFFVKFSDLDEDSEKEIWAWRLTHNKIVLNLFKLNGGNAGYYLVDISTHKFYYCGATLQFVKAKLRDLDGLASTFGLPNPMEVLVEEEAINPTESLDERYLIYEMNHMNRFRPYESRQFATPSDLKDFAISKRELYQRFLDINGGQIGFYAYQPSSDEVFYFGTKAELRSRILNLSPATHTRR